MHLYHNYRMSHHSLSQHFTIWEEKLEVVQLWTGCFIPVVYLLWRAQTKLHTEVDLIWNMFKLFKQCHTLKRLCKKKRNRSTFSVLKQTRYRFTTLSSNVINSKIMLDKCYIYRKSICRCLNILYLSIYITELILKSSGCLLCSLQISLMHAFSVAARLGFSNCSCPAASQHLLAQAPWVCQLDLGTLQPTISPPALVEHSSQPFLARLLSLSLLHILNNLTVCVT